MQFPISLSDLAVYVHLCDINLFVYKIRIMKYGVEKYGNMEKYGVLDKAMFET